MNLINKQLKIEKIDKITIEYVEKHMLELGYKPLRWSIVQTDDKFLTIDAVLIN